MLIYIIIFMISISLFVLSFKCKKNSVLSRLFIFLAILIPSLLAGYRDISVGTDTKGYVYYCYLFSHQFTSVFDYLRMMPIMVNVYDSLYLIFTFVILKIFDNFNVLLFFYEFFLISIVYKTIQMYSDKKSNVILGMVVFYCFWYNVSLNMIRQSLAISLTMLSLAFCNKKQYGKASIISVLAAGFHRTAIFNLLLNFIHYFFNKSEVNNREKSIISYFIYFSIIVMLIFFKPMISILSSLLGFHGNLYLQNMNFDISFLDNFIYIFIIVLFLLNIKYLEKSGINVSFYKLMLIVSFLLLQIGTFIPYGERFSFYFFYPIVINIIPLISDELLKVKAKTGFYYVSTVIAFFIIYWIVFFGIMNMHNTVPYVMVK